MKNQMAQKQCIITIILILCIFILSSGSLAYQSVTTDLVNTSEVTVQQLNGFIKGKFWSSNESSMYLNLSINGTQVDSILASNNTYSQFSSSKFSSYGLKVVRIYTQYNSTGLYYLWVTPDESDSNDGYLAVAVLILGVMAFFVLVADRIDLSLFKEDKTLVGVGLKYFFLLLAGWVMVVATKTAISISYLESYGFDSLNGIYMLMFFVISLLTVIWLFGFFRFTFTIMEKYSKKVFS